MNLAKNTVLLAALLAITMPYERAIADEVFSVDVVHYWVSKSESAALDVFRTAWTKGGNRWVDLAEKNETALQRTISDRIANGYPPAVMQWHANESARELTDMGIVQDIDRVAQEEHWHDILPPFMFDRITLQGKIYLAPTNIHTENWLWTSQAVFDALQLSTPTTWDEILAAADRIQATGKPAFALGGGSWEITLLFNNIMNYKLGSEGYARIMSMEADAVLDPRMLDALDMLRRISRYVEPAKEREGKSWADAAAMVAQGEAGMQIMGDWVKGELLSLGYAIDKDFGCITTPGTSIADFTVVDAFAFPLTSLKESDEAQGAFARMILAPENQLAFNRLKGSLPVRTDIDPQDLDRCGQLGMQQLKELQQGTPVRSSAMPSQVAQGLIAILDAFFNDRSISAQATQQQLYQLFKQG